MLYLDNSINDFITLYLLKKNFILITVLTLSLAFYIFFYNIFKNNKVKIKQVSSIYFGFLFLMLLSNTVFNQNNKLESKNKEKSNAAQLDILDYAQFSETNLSEFSKKPQVTILFNTDKLESENIEINSLNLELTNILFSINNECLLIIPIINISPSEIRNGINLNLESDYVNKFRGSLKKNYQNPPRFKLTCDQGQIE
ncbi:hypothetical protein [Aquirufa sp. Wall-65K1]